MCVGVLRINVLEDKGGMHHDLYKFQGIYATLTP